MSEKWTHPDVRHPQRWRGLNHSFLRLYLRVFDTSDPLEVKQGQMVGQGFLRPAPRLANLAAIAILRKGTEKGTACRRAHDIL